MKALARRNAISALALVACLATIAGCGGGSSTSGTQAKTTATIPSTPANAQFIGQADSICRRLNTELAAVQPKSKTLAEILRVVPRNLALERTGLTELEKLAPPSSLEDNWRQMLGYRRTLAAELAQFVSIAKQNDIAALKALGAKKERVHASLDKTGKASGFKDCATL
jgi:hypothetical protein